MAGFWPAKFVTGSLLARTVGAAVLLTLACTSPSWASNVYYAGPASTAVSGACSVASPCRLDYAVSLARAGDQVVVEPGTYSITYPVAGSGAFTISGQSGQPRPSLIGAASLTSDTLAVSGGASVSGLYVESNESDGRGGAALSIDGGKADSMILYASPSDSGGEALREKDSAAGTVVTDTVARSAAPAGAAVFFTDGASPGTATAVNLTAVGEAAGVVAFRGQMISGSAAVRNSIAHGGSGAMDFSAPPPTDSIDISYSNFRTVRPSDYWDRGGNQSASPLFANAAAHQYQEAPGSPTIGAGQIDSSDANLTDPDGNPRVTGFATDIGAYEYSPGDATGVPAAGPHGSSGPDGLTGYDRPNSGDASRRDGRHARPALGKTVLVRPLRGTILVKRAGSRAFVTLHGPSSVPVGSELDTRAGDVTLADAVDHSGRQQVASFSGGVFEVRQASGRRGLTDIVLRGGDFAVCRPRKASLRLATFSRARPKVVRQLWGRDHGGRFSTYGRSSIATVRGTIWLTQDRCDGTLTQVLEGRVLVYDLRRHRNVLVPAGHSYLAAAR